MATKHDALLNAILRATSKAPPQNRLPAAIAAAKAQGYLVHVKGDVSGGVRASAPLGIGSVQVSVPFVVKDNSGVRADKTGIYLTAQTMGKSFGLSVDTNGVDFESLQAVKSSGDSVLN